MPKVFTKLISAIKNGDIDRLLVPTDSQGLKCGVDSEVHKSHKINVFSEYLKNNMKNSITAGHFEAISRLFQFRKVH